MVKTVLVTGARGYIGRHVAWKLTRTGHKVVGLDLPTRKTAAQFEGEMSVELDLKDRPNVLRLFKENKIDAVVHLASLIEVGESIREPIWYYDENLSMSMSLLHAMEKTGVRRLAFACSAAVYGNRGDVVLREDLPTQPINPYGVTKTMLEQIFEDLTLRKKIDAVSLRLFNVAGLGSKSDRLDTAPVNTALIIPLLQRVAAEKRQITAAEGERVGVLSKGFPTPDGTVVRDYVHALDVANAFTLCVEKSNVTGSYNIAAGKSVSILDVIQEVERQTNYKFEIEWREAPAGFPSILKADISKARSALGYTPEHSSLENLVKIK